MLAMRGEPVSHKEMAFFAERLWKPEANWIKS